ncbi:hypothetical protein, partial [Sphingobium sp. Z007]
PPYFPAELAAPTVECGSAAHRWTVPVADAGTLASYAAFLAAAKEPVLYVGGGEAAVEGKRVVRFLWLRTFHPPIIVRIDFRRDKPPRLVAKRLTGIGSYEVGKVDLTIDRALDDVEADRVKALLAQDDMFTSASPSCGPPGTDGAQWMVGVIDAEGYHFTRAWSPRDGKVREIGLALLALAGWEDAEIY